MESFEIIRQEIANNCFEKSKLNREIDFLILHHLQANSTEETIEALEIHGVSAHYLIDINGVITQLVDDKDIAFHAGVSYWDKRDGINLNSIGVEFINPAPFSQNFSIPQMQAGVNLLTHLIDKYQILPRYVLGHSDIAYHRDSKLLDRKQDPSHLFNWQYLAENNIGLYPKNSNDGDNILLYEFGDVNHQIEMIKIKLQKFGYKLTIINSAFDKEMVMLARVFNRHFNNNADNRNHDFWLQSSDYILNELIKIIS